MPDPIFTPAALANMVISMGFTVLVEKFVINNSVATSLMNMDAKANIDAGIRHLERASRSDDKTTLREYSIFATDRFYKGLSGLKQVKSGAQGPLEVINCHFGLAICALMRKEWENLTVSISELEEALVNFDDRIKNSSREEKERIDKVTTKSFFGAIIVTAIYWPFAAAGAAGVALWAYLKDKRLSEEQRAEIKKREAQLVEQEKEILDYYGIENREDYCILPDWSDAWYVVRSMEDFIKSAKKVPSLV